ncbi:MAG: hypothetical protein HW387_618 [Parachlamydiales bacterium]|nr:hypothetical protein [Parachlamydiales bacterium]
MIDHNKFITNPFVPSCEGFGAQYLFIISAMNQAEAHNKQFVYTPFQSMAHNYDNDPNFLNKKENLVNFIDHFPINTDMEFQKECSGNGAFFNHQSESTKRIKKLFFANKDKKKHFSDQFTNIAIHIRNYTPNDYIEIQNQPDNAFYCKLVDNFRLKSYPRPPRFHIYSLGNQDKFNMLVSEDVFLHINESIEDTFTSMAFSDILLIAPSCFSYCAGFLSENTVWYLPDPGQIPLPHWKPIYYKVFRPLHK